ncbi:hypothetical protein [Dictyobacter arantiisoli]|uniref:Uncharacterized protein n=1 Tax=Dictyobacter arantiisoli TaxID=2014874 RepID=A0A5A5TAH0_9CHLR|nr:hypothetical protein [Dictyobacter arantiisoli]GCF08422.1 hypothetical protein KDI_19860 [Dictyobacter arantiisoli]
MGILRVLSKRGDDNLIWDEKKLQENDSEALAAVHEAERIFQKERARGSMAFRVQTGQPPQRIDQFDTTAEQIVMVPRVYGG